MARKVLGIDPGSHRMGIGCIEKSGNSIELLYSTTLEAPHEKSIYHRLHWITQEFGKVVDELLPAEVAVEDIFYAKNVRSAFYLGMARGAVITLCVARGLPIFEYAPTRVKSVVTGSGRADKIQVQKMLRLILGRSVPKSLDASDALAVAVCHVSNNITLGEKRW